MKNFEREPKIFTNEDVLAQEEEVESNEEIPETKIIGFEKLNFCDASGREMKGEEILREAAKKIPGNLRWLNVKKIEYKNEKKGASENYAMRGTLRATFEGGEKSIEFHGIPEEIHRTRFHNEETCVNEFSRLLAHDWAHSIDPGGIDQPDMSDQEREEMIKKWANVREKEKPFCAFIEKIKNKNKDKEEDIKSEEDFAESIVFTLFFPEYIKKVAPERYEFCCSLLKKRFPDFYAEKNSEK